MKIEKPGFTIREWRPGDAESLAENIDDKDIWNNMRDGLPHPYTLKDAETFIRLSILDFPSKNFTIAIDGKAVGGIGYVPLTDIERVSAEIGYWIGRPYWNRGIVTQAVMAFTEYIWTHTTILRLFACVFEYNIASQRVLEKAGFRTVGILEKAAVKNGKVWNFHYYELTKPE